MNNHGKSMGVATLLTAAHFAAKLVGGLLTNSLALISDAWHLLTDLLALILSWWSLRQSEQPPTNWATYGFHRVGILVALVNNISLIGISIYILYEAYIRFIHPETIHSEGMMLLSIVGIVASAIIAYLMNDGAKNNLNIRSVWLHFAGEALASIGILVGSIIIYYTNWYFIDTMLSTLLSLAIMRGALIMLWDITLILLEGVPRHISTDKIEECITEIPCITAARDIHVWCLAEEKIALSAHVELKRDVNLSQTEPILSAIKQVLSDKFNINHINIQFELHECEDCIHSV